MPDPKCILCFLLGFEHWKEGSRFSCCKIMSCKLRQLTPHIECASLVTVFQGVAHSSQLESNKFKLCKGSWLGKLFHSFKFQTHPCIPEYHFKSLTKTWCSQLSSWFLNPIVRLQLASTQYWLGTLPQHQVLSYSNSWINSSRTDSINEDLIFNSL